MAGAAGGRGGLERSGAADRPRLPLRPLPCPPLGAELTCPWLPGPAPSFICRNPGVFGPSPPRPGLVYQRSCLRPLVSWFHQTPVLVCQCSPAPRRAEESLGPVHYSSPSFALLLLVTFLFVPWMHCLVLKKNVVYFII